MNKPPSPRDPSRRPQALNPLAAFAPSQQMPLFARRAITEYPQREETADSLGEVDADDGLMYHIKGDASGSPMRASEWICSHLAEEVGIASPQPSVIERNDGSLVFGSRRLAGVAEQVATQAFLLRPSIPAHDASVSEIGSLLSGIYAFDLFIGNEDRHPKNYLSLEDRNRRRFYAFDFGRGLFWKWPLEGFPSPDGNTRHFGAVLRQLHGFDIGRANRVLDCLLTVDLQFIQDVLKRMPTDWLPAVLSSDLTRWWSSNAKCGWRSFARDLQMARSFKFVIVRLAPDGARDERLNVAAAVFRAEGLDLRISRRLDKVRAISQAIDQELLQDLFSNLQMMDEKLIRSGSRDAETRAEAFAQIGPLTVSKLGSFVAQNHAAYELRLQSIIANLVDPEISPVVKRPKRTRLLADLKSALRRERVLAQKDEGLASHRVVPSFPLDEGLVADLVLQNGALHVIETVDAVGDANSLRRTISDIAMANLVLSFAKLRFGDQATKARLVYHASPSLEVIARPSLEAAEHQGALLINWSSANDRREFVQAITSLATPRELKKATLFVSGPKQLKLH